MDRLTREEIELWRKICESHWVTDPDGAYLSHAESARQANTLCDLALQSLSQEAVRDEALEALQNYAESFSADDEGLHLAPETWNRMRELIRALKREPNAAAQVSSRTQMPEQSGKRPAPAAPDVQQPLQPVDPNRVHAGWNIKGEPVYLDEPLAPDVASM